MDCILVVGDTLSNSPVKGEEKFCNKDTIYFLSKHFLFRKYPVFSHILFGYIAKKKYKQLLINQKGSFDNKYFRFMI